MMDTSHPAFQAAMAEATRLTQAGDLRAATAAIQAAFGAGSPAGFGPPMSPASPPTRGDVIDVEARVVPTPDAAAPASPTPAPDTASAPPAAAASAAGSAGGVLTGQHTERAGTREYRLYLPPGESATPRPLVVMLHGCTQHPDDFAAGTAMDELARQAGVAVLYPAQSQKANPQRCWNWFKHSHQQRGRGEPSILAGMTRAVVERHGLDPRRVFVAGLSAGGAMAAILGASYPELYAAVGVHSGLAAGAAQDLPSALAAMRGGAAVPPRVAGDEGALPPTIVFHGDADGTVHPSNGEQALTQALPPGAAEAASERVQAPGGRQATRRVYRSADGRLRAELWTVHGAGHAWSGGRRAGSYTDPGGPDASAQMLRFFLEQAPAGR